MRKKDAVVPAQGRQHGWSRKLKTQKGIGD